MNNFDRELRRGTLELLLLRILLDGEAYGYRLITQLRERSQGHFEMKEGTLYPVLYRLEDAGWIVSKWQQPSRGVPRKYYALTENGRRRLEELTQAWAGFAAAVESVLSGTQPTEEEA